MSGGHPTFEKRQSPMFRESRLDARACVDGMLSDDYLGFRV